MFRMAPWWAKSFLEPSVVLHCWSQVGFPVFNACDLPLRDKTHGNDRVLVSHTNIMIGCFQFCVYIQFCDNYMLENAWILKNPMLGREERFLGYRPGLQPKNVRQPEAFRGFFCRRKRVHAKPLFERLGTFPLHDLQNTNARILGTPKFRRPV